MRDSALGGGDVGPRHGQAGPRRSAVPTTPASADRALRSSSSGRSSLLATGLGAGAPALGSSPPRRRLTSARSTPATGAACSRVHLQASSPDRAPRTQRPADGTPDAARRQRAHLPRILRPPAPHDVEGRARQRGLRLLQHRAAGHRRHQAGLRRGRVRPPGSDVPPRAVRRVQGHPPADAGRPARPVPEGPRGRRRAADPGLRTGRLRGGRRHRHDHRGRRTTRPRHDDRDRRPGHAPAGHGPAPGS